MIVTEFATEIEIVKGKEIVIVSEDVAVPEKETENVNVVIEIEKEIEGKESVIEETGRQRIAEIVNLSVQKRKKLELSKNRQMIILIMLQRTMRKETMKMQQ
jgi:hypothetical protein